MADPSKRQALRKRKVDENKLEHIIPITIEKDDEVSSTQDIVPKPERETSEATADDESSSNNSICNSVKQMNIGSDLEDEQAQEELTIIEDFKIPERIMPGYNVPEKIVIVFDCAKDEISTDFELGGETFSPADMLKRSLRFFLQNKHAIDIRHEFALIVLNENSAVWLKDFTNDVSVIINSLEQIACCETEDIIYLNSLFDLISSKVNIPTGSLNVPPPFVVRTLFVYGRSFTKPDFDEQQLRRNILDSPFFTFDILMTHEIPSAKNNCVKIFQFLQSIDKKGYAYFFPVARNAYDLHVAMAKLLSHPLQRPCQKIANYIINIGGN